MNLKLLFLILSTAILFFMSAGCGKEEPVSAQNMKEEPSQATEQQNGNSDNINENGQNHNNEMKNMEIRIHNGRTLVAILYDNSSARALVELLEDGDIVVEMDDYANMEKVGRLGTSLPRNDEYIKTSPGDLILYQGNQFVIYYGNNSWSLTRLGKIIDTTPEELRQALGEGSVTVTLSVRRETSSIR